MKDVDLKRLLWHCPTWRQLVSIFMVNSLSPKPEFSSCVGQTSWSIPHTEREKNVPPFPWAVSFSSQKAVPFLLHPLPSSLLFPRVSPWTLFWPLPITNSISTTPLGLELLPHSVSLTYMSPFSGCLFYVISDWLICISPTRLKLLQTNPTHSACPESCQLS